MLGKDIVGLLSDQVAAEFFAAYLYLDISNYYKQCNLDGFGNWFRVQAQEECDHALLLLTYLQNNNERPVLGAVPAPGHAYADFKQPLAAALKHECGVTAQINAMYAAAADQKDFRTMQFLDWFIKEQGEEEKNTEDLLGRYELFGGDARGLYLLDAELAARVYTAPDLVL